MSKKYEFQIPEPRGLGAKVPQKFRDYNPISLKPTDDNQNAPTPSEPVRQRYKEAGGC